MEFKAPTKENLEQFRKNAKFCPFCENHIDADADWPSDTLFHCSSCHRSLNVKKVVGAVEPQRINCAACRQPIENGHHAEMVQYRGWTHCNCLEPTSPNHAPRKMKRVIRRHPRGVNAEQYTFKAALPSKAYLAGGRVKVAMSGKDKTISEGDWIVPTEDGCGVEIFSDRQFEHAFMNADTADRSVAVDFVIEDRPLFKALDPKTEKVVTVDMTQEELDEIRRTVSTVAGDDMVRDITHSVAFATGLMLLRLTLGGERYEEFFREHADLLKATYLVGSASAYFRKTTYDFHDVESDAIDDEDLPQLPGD